MRWIANVSGDPEVKRLLIHEEGEGTFLFTYDSEEDGPCSDDSWFESPDDARGMARELYGVSPGEWKAIPDPPEGCQQDWIAPARVRGRQSGNPEWGKFEVLRDGKWVDVTPP